MTFEFDQRIPLIGESPEDIQGERLRMLLREMVEIQTEVINQLNEIQSDQWDFDLMPEVGGDPLQEIITNANGVALRYASGVQHCYTTSSITATGVAVTTAFAGGFRNTSNAAGVWTFPAAFVDTDYWWIATPLGDHLISQQVKVNASSAYARVFRVASTTIDTSWQAFAIGLWK